MLMMVLLKAMTAIIGLKIVAANQPNSFFCKCMTIVHIDWGRAVSGGGARCIVRQGDADCILTRHGVSMRARDRKRAVRARHRAVR